jgi:hypothetical protein
MEAIIQETPYGLGALSMAWINHDDFVCKVTPYEVTSAMRYQKGRWCTLDHPRHEQIWPRVCNICSRGQQFSLNIRDLDNLMRERGLPCASDYHGMVHKELIHLILGRECDFCMVSILSPIEYTYAFI